MNVEHPVLLSFTFIGDHSIDPSVNVRNLGMIFDNSISMVTHINQVCKTAFYHIHNIRRISKYLSQESLKTLVHAFVTSTLWNSLPANIREITSLSIFKKKLKTHFFNLAYNE